MYNPHSLRRFLDEVGSSSADLRKLGCVRLAQLLEKFTKVSPHGLSMELDRTDDTVIGGCHLGSGITAIVQGNVSGSVHASHRTFGNVVVYRQGSVLNESRQFIL